MNVSVWQLFLLLSCLPVVALKREAEDRWRWSRRTSCQKPSV